MLQLHSTEAFVIWTSNIGLGRQKRNLGACAIADLRFSNTVGVNRIQPISAQCLKITATSRRTAVLAIDSARVGNDIRTTSFHLNVDFPGRLQERGNANTPSTVRVS
jgi:hypothetical protein